MSASNTSLSGIKIPSPRRLKNEAVQLRRHDPQLGQVAALNKAAKTRGWPSYKAAERAWHADNRVRFAHAVTLTAHWADKRTGGSGQLHAHVMLSEPWANFLPLAVRRGIGGLGQFHIVRRDRTQLTAPWNYASHLSCLHNLSKAARQLVFVDALRVLPVSLSKAVEAFHGDQHKMLTSRYPNQDHESLWCDPATGLHFILNEPYQIDEAEQSPVLTSRGMVAFATHEWTIHNPEGTLAQLIAPACDHTLLEAVRVRSKILPKRFSEIAFTDEDGQSVEAFR